MATTAQLQSDVSALATKIDLLIAKVGTVPAADQANIDAADAAVLAASTKVDAALAS